MAAKELLAQLHEVAANPRKQLDKYLAEGKKVVAVTYYTPQEIVHSMGLVPMGVWGADMEINEAKKYYPAFICSITVSYTHLNEFHGCLLDAVGKKDVMEIIREDYIHFRRWRNFDVVRTGRQAEIIKEHTALMNALMKNQTKEAHEILHLHLNTTNRLR